MSKTITARMIATFEPNRTETAPQNVKISATFATETEAADFAALFPKSYRVHAGTISYGVSYKGSVDRVMSNGETATFNAENPIGHFVEATVKLVPTKGNDRNEGGIKRLQNFLKKLEKAGHRYEYMTPYGNSYPSVDALAAAIGADLVAPVGDDAGLTIIEKLDRTFSDPAPAPAVEEAPVETETETADEDLAAWPTETLPELRAREAAEAAASKTCSNTTPIDEDLANMARGYGRDGVCSECGAFLAILITGRFRRHARRLKPGNPKIAESVAARRANLEAQREARAARH